MSEESKTSEVEMLVDGKWVKVDRNSDIGRIMYDSKTSVGMGRSSYYHLLLNSGILMIPIPKLKNEGDDQ